VPVQPSQRIHRQSQPVPEPEPVPR
jgi:hypothetical protein